MGKKITVIVPVYNKCAYVDRTIRSLTGQTHEDLQIILVNDGSTDGSEKICEAWARRDARILYIDQENAGPSAARNTGLEAAEGEYVTFLDADDTFQPWALEKLFALAEQYDADLAVADQQMHKGDAVYRHTCLAGRETGLLSREAFASNFSVDIFWGQQENKLYKKELIDTNHLRFDSNCRHQEDFLFNLACFQRMGRIVYLNEMVCDVYDVPASLSKEVDIEGAIKLGGDIWREMDAFFDAPDLQKYKPQLNIYFYYVLSGCLGGLRTMEDHSLSAVHALLKRIAQEDWVQICIRNAKPYRARHRVVLCAYRLHLYWPLSLLFFVWQQIKPI